MASTSKAKVRFLALLLVVLLGLAMPWSAQAEPVVASYYGQWFVGLPTASGQPYDPYGFTAAHPYLPFGTKLLVSYNGRSVIVTVNDRIPYGSDRDLDLSLAAAQAIGLTDVGYAVVNAEVVETQPASSA